MALSVVQRASNAGGLSTTIAATFTQAPTADNVLLAVVASNNDSAPTIAGWTQLVQRIGGSRSLTLFGRLADGTESATVTATFGTNTSRQIAITEVATSAGQWADLAEAIEATDSNASGITTNTWSTPNLAPAADAYLLAGAQTFLTSSAPRTVGSPWTLRADQASRLLTADLLDGEATFAAAFTIAGTARAWHTVVVAIHEPPPPVPTRIHVQEQPPTDASVFLGHEGQEHRIAGEDAENTLSSLTKSSTLPGGYALAEATVALKREDGLRMPKHTPYRIQGPGGATVWQGRLDETPRPSNRDATLAGIGMDALMHDVGPVARFLGVMSDLTQWSEPHADRGLLLAQLGTAISLNEAFSVELNESAIKIALRAEQNTPSNHYGEVWFLGCPPGQKIAEVQYIASQLQQANMNPQLRVTDTADGNSGFDDYGFTSGLTLVKAELTPERQYAAFRDTPSASVNKIARLINIYRIAVFADHGLERYPILQKNGTALPDGLLFSDVMQEILRIYVPGLRVSRYGVSTVRKSAAPGSNWAWLEPTEIASMLEEGFAADPRYDWGVWEGRIFEYDLREDMGRVWEVRRSEGAEFEGLSVESEPEYNAAAVIYQTNDGITKVAGPPGINADIEDNALLDRSSSNPVNASGVPGVRPYIVELPEAVDDDQAVEFGTIAMEEALRPRYSGQVKLPHALRTTDGVLRPTIEMEARDWIIDKDAANGLAMPLVEAGYEHGAADGKPTTATIDQEDNSLEAAIQRHGMRPRKLPTNKLRRRLRRRRARLKRKRQHATHAVGPSKGGSGTGKA